MVIHGVLMLYVSTEALPSQSLLQFRKQVEVARCQVRGARVMITKNIPVKLVKKTFRYTSTVRTSTSPEVSIILLLF